MMKTLIVINGRGESYDLLEVDRSPTFQVEGFGYEDNTDFMRIGSGYYALEDVPAQGELSLKILLWKDVDKVYKEFISHCRHEPLTILYGDDVGEFYYPCKLKAASKTEKVGIDIKGVATSFLLTGNPYKILSTYNEGTTGEGKQYSYTYPYVYSNDTKNMLRIQSDSYVHSPVILTIYGETTNPVWRHYCNGILVETGAYSGTIPEGNRLVIDSKAIPYSVLEYDSNGNIVADRYRFCDYSTERFMHACEGSNLYVVGHDGINPIRMKVEAYIEYETV